ncbi:MAG TPA: lectin-like protein [Alphaproteobacteria bacterium]|nr:lectin-like protein [Alphaproteobacteria bacterium]
MPDNLLSSVQRNVLRAIQQTNINVGQTQLALASGKRVQTVLDNPQNFFQSKYLQNESADLSKLLDGISGNIRTIQETNIGVETMLNLIDLAESLIEEGLKELFPRTDETADPEAIQYIIDKNPGKAYLASTNNFYQNTTDFATWTNARDRAAQAILNAVPEIRGHLATITSQEENDTVFGLLTATSWLGGSDNEVEGEWRWVVGPEAGQQFWQGLAGGTAVNGSYENWAPGEPNQFFGPGNPENYAHLRADGLWNDLPESDTLNYIIEWGGDLFIENPDINVSSESVEYRNKYLEILGQIDAIAADANYRGINLLEKDNLETTFNRENRSRLTTQGIDASTVALGLTNDNFISKTEMTKILTELRGARETLRDYSASLQNDLGIITSRRDYIEQTINTLKSGAEDLTIADQNEKGANMLALQVRQQLQFEALSLTSQSNILDLFL